MALPLPKVVSDVGPGGGLVTSMRGANALSNDMLDNVIKGAEAQYAPYTAYSNAASKLAYSQFVAPQAIANVLTSPNSRGMFTPEAYNNLANVFSRQVSSGPSTAMASLPPPKSRSAGLLDMIVNKLSSIGQQPTQTGSSGDMAGYDTNNASNAGNPLSYSPGQPSSPGEPAANPFSPTGSPSDLAGSSPTYSRNTNALMPGTFGAANPAAITSAGEAGLKSQSEAEGKAITDQWKERQDDINEQVKGAQEMKRQLAKLDDARSRLKVFKFDNLEIPLESGPISGRLPGFSDAAQDSDIALNNLVAARLKAWQSNRITNMDLGFGKGLKAGRYMNDESYRNEVNYENGLASRTEEYPAFASIAQSKGLLPAQADAIWARYANEKPFYDPKTKEVIDKNLETWEDYLTPQSMQETFSPQLRKQMESYRKNMAGGNPEQDEKIQKNYNEFKSTPSPAAKMLAKKLQLPDFKSQDEFKSWYAKQDKMVKDAVRLKLGNK